MNILLFKSKMSVPKFLSRLLLFTLLCGVQLLSLSCVNTKQATYFNNSDNRTFSTNVENLEPVIQSNDLLSINVSSVNPEAAEIFNSTSTSSAQFTTLTGNTRVSGYLVERDGYIRFPVLGEIKAAGRTKNELRDEITNLLVDRKFLLDPTIDIRFLNYKVSILGEVKNPSVLTVPSEKISILEALGMAGDITIFGKRDNVRLIREEAGVKRVITIDLTSNEIFDSPYFYLKSNDIIYVEPNKSKIAGSGRLTQWIPVALSAISLAIIAIVNFN